ncbi:TonB-dependent hemoglobin/transferrin/lactoferrin family receptor [Azospirillum sp. TSO22-1]|uniref:TonB-dependent hemoglobin/transferrin/lactoferrin family receptor n=1 Tax=Azospirillum sp. TSO22-1 TaxID=716789 RepID=UPI000D6436E3|nr:TonB-dependent hemoglobin/transferrin/lactoferrin family receptor [Azospirillum sp. TSO22-1]
MLASRSLPYLAPLPFVLLLASPALAADDAVQVGPVSVTATRSEKSVYDTPQTVTVIGGEELERRNQGSLRDITRYEPGIDVGNQPARAGATNYTIRGIGENRVRVQIDGVRVPDFPESNVGPGTYTRDFVDPETLKRVEIVRGPASALYGSDAIGGVVAYVTKDPEDYLARVGKDWAALVKGGYDSADNSLSKTMVAAARAAWADVMVAYTRRDGHEVKPNGSVAPNPQDFGSNNVLAKLVVRPTESDKLRFTVESFQRRTETDLQSERTATVLSSLGDDNTKRLRLSVDHVHTAPIGFIDRLEWRLYTTRVTRDEDTEQLRRSGTTLSRRMTNLDFRQSIVGGDVQATSEATLFGLKNTFTYGASLDRAETSRPRDRYETNLATGAVTRSFSGGPGVPAEVFPNKNYPDTTTIQAGAYVQDEVAYERFTFTPAVRVDYYKMTPHPDAAFRTSNSLNRPVQEVSDFAVSPKLGVTYALTEQYKLYGLYARGFRSPPFDSANNGYVNGPQRYEMLPNPDLKAETSHGFETGLRGRFAGGSNFGVNAFYNLYDDFIDSQVIGTRNGITQYQYRNLPQVEIWGLEARGEWRLNPEWAVFGTAAYARGKDTNTGLPVDSVAPLTGVLGVRYDHASGFGAELIGRGAAKHERVSSPTYFQTPSYVVADATVSYEYDPTLTVNAGVFNIFDRKYFGYRDVTGVAANRTDLDRFARPGRIVGVNATLRW